MVHTVVYMYIPVVTLVTTMSPAKTDEPVQMLFRMWTCGAQGTVYYMGP